MADYIEVDGLRVGVNMVRYYRSQIVDQQDQIDSLRSQLDAHREACETATGILCGHNLPGSSPLVLMARKAMRELSEARAQCERLRSTLKEIPALIYIEEVNIACEDALSETPEQSLCEIEARAIEGFHAFLLKWNKGENHPNAPDEWRSGVAAATYQASEYAARLRQQAKENK